MNIPKPCPCLPRRIRAPWRACRAALLFLMPTLASAAAPAPPALPAEALASALALGSQAAAVLAPAGARVLALPGALDPRLRLAPCARVDAYLVAGVPAWGRTRVGLRCSSGPKNWRVFMPVTVQVWAPAAVPTATLPVGTRLATEQLTLAVSDWAATPQPPFAETAMLEGRTLARGVVAGQALRSADLQARRWFAAGQTVRVVTHGTGFAIATEGLALAAGVEGQRVRVRIGEDHIAVGRAVGPGLVEVGL